MRLGRVPLPGFQKFLALSQRLVDRSLTLLFGLFGFLALFFPGLGLGLALSICATAREARRLGGLQLKRLFKLRRASSH